MQGRQCTVSIGSVLADVYIAAATVNPTVQFYAERADRGPSMHLQCGPASCLATVEGSGTVESHLSLQLMYQVFLSKSYNGIRILTLS